jgi:hypothetical protein
VAELKLWSHLSARAQEHLPRRLERAKQPATHQDSWLEKSRAVRRR